MTITLKMEKITLKMEKITLNSLCYNTGQHHTVAKKGRSDSTYRWALYTDVRYIAIRCTAKQVHKDVWHKGFKA